jgi:hypothetical protein
MGYHALMGIELSPLYEEFLREKNTVVRGLGHPVLFGANPETSRQRVVSVRYSFYVLRIAGHSNQYLQAV